MLPVVKDKVDDVLIEKILYSIMNKCNNSLLILDDETNIEFLHGILGPEYVIYPAKDASSAIDMAEKFLPDVILLDVNGLNALSALKTSGKTKTIPVIVTGPDSVEDEKKGLELGAADYMCKPFNANIVRSWIMDQMQYAAKIRAAGQPANAGEAAQLPPITLPYARILIVDDVEINLDVAAAMMDHYGMQIDGVNSGQKAIDAIREEKHRYNAIFMDHIMPEIDGIKAAKIIREEIGTEYARTIPIIALTADSIADNEKIFLSNGFQAFLPKPIDAERLDEIIRQFVQDTEAEKSFGTESRNTEQASGRQVSISGIDGLDIQKGQERFGGRMDIYLKVLQSFTLNARALVEIMKGVSADNLTSEYAITVHGIKGSCWGIWAKAAGDQAELLENAAKAGDLDYVQANNQAFIELVSKLITDIEAAILDETPAQAKPKKDKPDRELLSKILAACEEFNMTEANALVKEMENFEYEEDDGLAIWLRENTDQMNWSDIVGRLTDWLQPT